MTMSPLLPKTRNEGRAPLLKLHVSIQFSTILPFIVAILLAFASSSASTFFVKGKKAASALSTNPLPFIAAILLRINLILCLSIWYQRGEKAASALSTKLLIPKLDKETCRYQKSPLDDGEYLYDSISSAPRHDPYPYLKRVFNANEYKHAILKYTSTAKVGQAEATGNTDAELNNTMPSIGPTKRWRRRMESPRWITHI